MQLINIVLELCICLFAGGLLGRDSLLAGGLFGCDSLFAGALFGCDCLLQLCVCLLTGGNFIDDLLPGGGIFDFVGDGINVNFIKFCHGNLLTPYVLRL